MAPTVFVIKVVESRSKHSRPLLGRPVGAFLRSKPDFPVSDFYGNFALQLAELILQILTRNRVISSSTQISVEKRFSSENKCKLLIELEQGI